MMGLHLVGGRSGPEIDKRGGAGGGGPAVRVLTVVSRG